MLFWALIILELQYNIFEKILEKWILGSLWEEKAFLIAEV